MSYPNRNGLSKNQGAGDAEETLRLIARLPAPAGLEDRVYASLRTAPRGGRVLAWAAAYSPLNGWLRSVAAAAIVCVVAGGGWGIYSHVQPGQPARAVAGPRIVGPGEFSEGGAVRRPQTLIGPTVPEVNASTGGRSTVGTPAPAKAFHVPQGSTANKVGPKTATDLQVAKGRPF